MKKNCCLNLSQWEENWSIFLIRSEYRKLESILKLEVITIFRGWKNLWQTPPPPPFTTTTAYKSLPRWGGEHGGGFNMEKKK